MTDDDLAAIEAKHSRLTGHTGWRDKDDLSAAYLADMPKLLSKIAVLQAENEELLALSARVNEPKAIPCAFEGCTEQAVRLACGRTCGYSAENNPRHPGVASYCNDHAAKVALEGSPEYVAGCPHCGCAFGV